LIGVQEAEKNERNILFIVIEGLISKVNFGEGGATKFPASTFNISHFPLFTI